MSFPMQSIVWLLLLASSTGCGTRDSQTQAPITKPTAAEGGAAVAVGQQALEIEGEDIDGKPFKLSDYRGKVVMLDFWGNW